nr:tyrosine-protein phosphatase [Kibdelosporangium aridum]
MHCSAGRDQTGVLVALALSVAACHLLRSPRITRSRMAAAATQSSER